MEDPDHGWIDVKPVIKLGTGYVICIPSHWVWEYCDPKDIRVTVEALEGEPGFIVRPVKSLPPAAQLVFSFTER